MKRPQNADPFLDSNIPVGAFPKDEVEDELAASHRVYPVVPVLELVKHIPLVLRPPLVGHIDCLRERVPCFLSYPSNDASGWGFVHHGHQSGLIKVLPVVDLKFVLRGVSWTHDY